ncbi:response regulator [Lewinella cohaerens]|uniref:response regulator n=1 Tax=Lewinella cohaerens TaxID=70995 RepID=UPI000475F7CC|nr:response regulator transcription factor [Lewinella cohaerens]
MKKISLAIVEDEQIIRKSLTTYLGKNPEFELFQVSTSVEGFLAAAANSGQKGPDVILLDIQLPGINGIEGIPAIKTLFPEVDIIILTTFEDEEKIFAALSAGACSYLSKRTPLQRIQEAILTVYRGGSYMSPSVARKIADHFMPKQKVEENAILTARQQDIVNGIVDGLSYKMVANRLDISLDTVRTHIKHIYRALNINSKGELIKKAIKKGWVS